MTTNLSKVVKHLHHLLSPPGGERTDGELLARFVATRDEASFEALMRRHGPMVLAVCRRLLGHVQDAEDCFQATFMVLARKAATVKSDSVGSWLYAVAYRTSLEARAINARRRTREKQVQDMPHPEVMPPESQDWRPRLDRELNRLPEKYRAAIVACDLEGRSRKEAARSLGLAEGTLSSRLARGRRLLAKRLAPYGLPLSGVALASVLVECAASASVPAALVCSTTKAALLAAAGDFAAASASSAILMKGVLKSMFLTKLKTMIGAVMIVTVLGASGLVYRASGLSASPAEKQSDGKPVSELERLRHENELLKLNLEVVLEKVRAQEAELRALKAQGKITFVRPDAKNVILDIDNDGVRDLLIADDALLKRPHVKTEEKQKPRSAHELYKAVEDLKTTLKTLRENVKGEEMRKIEKALQERLDRLTKEHEEQQKKETIERMNTQSMMQMQLQQMIQQGLLNPAAGQKK
jgi:RNA polymerase sigma factor (sigma-70 family)